MEENKLPIELKAEVKADLTKTVEKTYDDTLKKPLTSSSKILTTVLDFFHNTILYPLQQYNLYAKNKLENYSIDLENKAKSIPQEYLTNPKVNILGPVFDGLKYNLDEEHIKEMFTNILLSDMDKRTQSKVLPSYIEVVKQLSSEDAQMLKFFKENNIKNEPIMKLKYILKSTGYIYTTNNLILIQNNSYDILDSIIIDNLLRLKLINIKFDELRNDRTPYNSVFEQIKQRKEFNPLPQNVEKLDHTDGLIQISDFGQNFIDICLS